MDNPKPALLPYPATITLGGAKLRFAGSVIVAFSAVSSERLERAVDRFQAGLERIAGKRSHDEAATVSLQISCDSSSARYPQLGDAEDYRLTVGPLGVAISATGEWGVLHGLSTLAQLLEATPAAPDCEIPYCEIADAPRFAWRGVLIDVARHFIGVEALRRTLDGMALCKLNVLHLHLTDDQGFRFPSRQFPALPSAECFSRSELAALVEYAADRGVRVVPEIDIPGHTNCWLVSYPEWGTGTAQPTRRFGVHQACLDPSNESVYAALELLLAEVADVFPDRHLHLGGDEVHSAWWTASASVQEFMVDEAIPDVAALQAYFISRVTQIVARLHRTPVGWDEVLHSELPQSVVVQCWRGATARDRALSQGNDCVVSSNYYLDLFYPADVHYRFDPQADEASLTVLEDGLLDDVRFAHVADGMRWTHQWRESAAADVGTGRVLGAEACLWSELVADSLIDVRLWSRLPALAERFWSPARVTDIEDLYSRLATCFEHLAALNNIDVIANSQSLIADTGLGAEWWPLIDMLEPVKWYGRLLGAQALAARIQGKDMPQSRPYNADTPLNRVVDGLLPESLAVRRIAALCRRHLGGDLAAPAELERFARGWQALAGQAGGLPELAGSARLLAAVGSMVIGVMGGEVDRESALGTLDAAAEPQGEYLLAVVPVLRSWVESSRR